VEDRLDREAGARFVIELPAEELAPEEITDEEMAT
jgi:hypothetical protein